MRLCQMVAGKLHACCSCSSRADGGDGVVARQRTVVRAKGSLCRNSVQVAGVTAGIKCVLIVDDDVDTLENLEEILEREGFNVQGARCGEEALKRLNESPGPCVVLLDLVMPEGDGWDVLNALLSLRHLGTATHPVIIISGAADADSALRMPGVVAVLRKPFDIDALVATVREHAAAIGEGPAAQH